MGIALPTWIVESQNNWIVLAAYGLLIGVGIPMLVARWWYGSRSRTKDGVLNATALSFFIKLKDSTKADEIPLMLAQTQELASDYVSQLGQPTRMRTRRLKERRSPRTKSFTVLILLWITSVPTLAARWCF